MVLQDEERTAEVMDAEGWFATGDVAELTTCGAIKIIDRVKSIVKLARGAFPCKIFELGRS